MSYGTSYTIRYNLGVIWHQAEVATMIAAQDVINEDPVTPDHAKRIEWANWANTHSQEAFLAFLWPLSRNQSIMSSVEANPDGSTVSDGDVQFVVNSALEGVINGWTPPAQTA